MLEEIIIAAIAGGGAFSLVGRFLDYQIQRRRLKAQNSVDESTATKNYTDAFAQINEFKDEMMEMFRKERDDCRKDIENLRQRYASDIERLNGERDELVKRVNALSAELQKITDPKTKATS